MPTTYKVELRARIPKRDGYSLTRAQEDEVKARLADADIADYLINTVGWDWVDSVEDTIVIYYDV